MSEARRSIWIQRFEEFKERVRTGLPFEQAADRYGIKFDDQRRAICFHHNDHDPSLRVFDDGLGAYCYAENRAFDVFDLIADRERCSFVEAVKIAGAMIGETFDGVDEDNEEIREELKIASERRRVEQVLTDAAIYMNRNLPRKYRRHLRENYGLDDATIDRYRIGWADTEGLLLYLGETGLKYSKKEILASGLFVDLGSRGLACFFDRRIVFPYWRHGRVVYAIGRRTDDTSDADHEKAKYKKLLLHSDKHPFVSKTIANDYLFGEDTVRGSSNHVVITEGVADALVLIMLGFAVLSPVTTRVRKKDTPRLVELTRRIPRVSVLNDNEENESGTKGALVMGEALFREGRDVRLPMLPRPSGVEKIDVCDFVQQIKRRLREEGETEERELNRVARERIDKVLEHAQSYVAFLIDRIPQGLDPADLNPRLAPIFEVVATCPPVERDGYVKQIAKRFSLRRQTVEASVNEHVEDDERRDQQDEAAEKEATRSAAADFEDERVRGKVFEDLDHYYIQGRFFDEVISSFTIVGRELIETEHGQTLVHGIIRPQFSDSDIPHTFSARAWSSKREFLREIGNIAGGPALRFTGNDDNVQGILACVAPEKLKRRKGTTNLGLAMTKHGPRWVTPTMTFGVEGIVNDDDPNEVLFVDTKSPISKRLRYRFPEQEELRARARDLLPKIVELNDRSVTLPLIGWFTASILKPFFDEEFGHFPIMLVHGTQGSGKTSIVRDVFWRLVGVRSDPFSCSDSNFSNARNMAASNSIPLFLDEYKRDMGRNKIEAFHRFLRRAYNSEIEFRGRADQSMNEYPLHTPIVVAGEMRPDDDPALTERLISVNPDKNAITSERKRLFGEVTRAPLEEIAGPFVSFVIGQDFKSNVKTAREIVEALLSSIGISVPPRCNDALIAMVFGIIIFEAFAESLGVELPEIDHEEAFRSVVDELLDGGNGAVKDAFDGFVEYCSTLSHLGHLVEGIHYTLEGDKLFLRLALCHAVYCEQRRKAGLEDGTNGLRALKKIIREKHKAGSYVADMSARVNVDGERFRAVLIDQSKVPESFDFDRFPANGEDKPGDFKTSWRGRGYSRDPEESYGPS